MIFWSRFKVSTKSITHEQSKYNVFDIFGDVGGLLELTMLFFGLFIRPYNYTVFLFNSIQELFKTPMPLDSYLHFLCVYKFGCCSKKYNSAKVIEFCDSKI